MPNRFQAIISQGYSVDAPTSSRVNSKTIYPASKTLCDPSDNQDNYIHYNGAIICWVFAFFLFLL